MSKLTLTVAAGNYDIVRALKEGVVEAEGLNLIFRSEMGPRERHWRMARRHEFDVCEENVGAYYMLRDRGEPIVAIPVFLHRRFRHAFLFVNRDAGIRTPKDLIGKSIGGTNFRPASNVWMRGIHWWSLPYVCVAYILQFIKENPQFLRFIDIPTARVRCSSTVSY